MKKMVIITAMLFAGLFTYCYGQDVKVNINNQDYSSNGDCDFKINGICSSEDIGGVDVQFKIVEDHNNCDDLGAVFNNYNKFPVTVLCKVSYKFMWNSSKTEEKTFNIVLEEQGRKVVNFDCGSISTCSVEGMIVRKLAQ